jgi:MoaA/NifB/PqqE/SkfB family radical SAM enzyme
MDDSNPRSDPRKISRLPAVRRVLPGRGLGYELASNGPGGRSPQVLKTADEMTRANENALHVSFDITNKCNLRCIMCHFTFDEVFHQPSSHMTPETFEKIAKQIQPHTTKLTLSAAYEPTASPYFTEILKISSDYGFLNIDFLTNGNSMSGKLIDQIVASKVADIYFSVHAARPDTYAHILRGGNLARVVENIKRLNEAKKKAQSTLPRIQFNIALMNSNIDELSEIIELAHECGATSVAFRHLIIFDGLEIKQESLSLSDRRLANSKIQSALEVAKRLGIKIFNSPDYFDTPMHDSHSQWTDWSAEPCAWSLSDDTAPPIGALDQPSGPVPPSRRPIDISGWALSDTGVHRIMIARDPMISDDLETVSDIGLVDIGPARFHNSTRNDVLTAFPTMHYGYRAGWSFKLTPVKMPDHSNEAMKIYAVAIGRNGKRAIIGSFDIRPSVVREPRNTAVRCDKPFNSIYIDSRGHVYPYPDCHTSKPFGIFDGRHFEEILFGPELNDLRCDLIEGVEPEMCINCPLFINREVNDDSTFKTHDDFSSEEYR